MQRYDDNYTIKHLCGDHFGYKIVKHGPNVFQLYYISGLHDVEYGLYDSLDVALVCAEALMETIRNPC